MLSLAEARALLLADLPQPLSEVLPFDQCAGRILAGPIAASRDQPPEPVSAMDGYAVRASDASAGAVLRLIGEAPAGAPFNRIVSTGEAVRIATGGVVPDGADAILIQENARVEGNEIAVTEPPSAGQFIRTAGCDFAAGQQLAGPADELTPALLGLAAAANLAMLSVVRRPRVAILPSGDELREPGSSLARGAIVNSAAYAIAPLIELWGGNPRRLPILADDAKDCEEALSGEKADVLVTIGGASVGDRDLFRPAADRLGARILFDRVAVRPGKPTWHARFPDGRLLLGLPGNPASAFVCGHLFLKPLIFALTGRDPNDAVRFGAATLKGTIPANGERENYLRGSVTNSRDGHLVACTATRQDSSLLTPLAAGNALIRRLPNAPPARTGDLIEFLHIEPYA